MTLLPERIVCLSAESADWLWRLGAWERVVGVTSFFEQPPEGSPKPRVGGFSSGRVKDIIELNPDLLITFSDVQAALAAELIKAGLPVLATNQRTIAEIEATLRMIGRIVGCDSVAAQLLDEFHVALAPVQRTGDRVRVYFEEWNNPLISGIAWVSELIERAGGCDVFGHLRAMRAATERRVTPEQVRAADPEVIIASWCGMAVRMEEIVARDGWNTVAAVKRRAIYEIPSHDILQPGFRLIRGFQQLKAALHYP